MQWEVKLPTKPLWPHQVIPLCLLQNKRCITMYRCEYVSFFRLLIIANHVRNSFFVFVYVHMSYMVHKPTLLTLSRTTQNCIAPQSERPM
jgi:hypothetical protein